ncbi:hypothetical protein GCM10010965_12340 [Caldalkalibacillus thermarum]|uniref:hypothetical protein n=1 Tax=Caldalkalibacillus thermarum TaxID=296745 RepID=UPI0016665073|nr:hypothetical protein [Caldalkalibacillus thermarum]GGK20806.1 hypothetical protein GCM10010965_12340 [Caldalkalibacillus thermarum]
MEKKTRSGQSDELYKAERFNSRALMEAYNNVVDDAGAEFAGELGVVDEDTLEASPHSALLYTHKQAMDAYREGTVEARRKYNQKS